MFWRHVEAALLRFRIRAHGSGGFHAKLPAKRRRRDDDLPSDTEGLDVTAIKRVVEGIHRQGEHAKFAQISGGNAWLAKRRLDLGPGLLLTHRHELLFGQWW